MELFCNTFLASKNFEAATRVLEYSCPSALDKVQCE